MAEKKKKSAEEIRAEAKAAKREADEKMHEELAASMVTPEEDFPRKRLGYLVSKYGEVGGQKRFEVEKKAKFDEKALHP